MPESGQDPAEFRITLRENGMHSLYRGLDAYAEYERSGIPMLLKEAIMFLHHGVELLMKQILVQHSPYLIFEDLRSVPKKQKQADELGIGIFFLEQPPKTVTYDEAVSRVDALVKPPELNAELLASLEKLNRLRNQLEHYAIEADRDEVIRLLAELREPLLDLFEVQIGGIRRLEQAETLRIWDGVEDSVKEYIRVEAEVFDVVRQFRGQGVPGRLLNEEGEFILPTFAKVLLHYRIPESSIVVDILGEADPVPWLVEVKLGRHISNKLLYMLKSYGYAARARPWLIVFANVPPEIRVKAKAGKIMLTGAKEWDELKRLVLRDTP